MMNPTALYRSPFDPRYLTRAVAVLFMSIGVLLGASAAHALTPEQVLAMSVGDSDARSQAIAQTAASGDPAAQSFFQAP